MKATWNVNGRRYEVEAPDEMPTLWVLRDILNLKGTKFGCGAGLCGACTIHLDNSPTRSCQVPASAIGTRTITTIEGLAPNGSHPLQRAWDELDVPQCGYCQAGQIMSAAALLRTIPSPTDQQIDNAMSGNLCRCGTYLRIHAAIKRAASMASGRAASEPPATQSSEAL